MKMPRMTNPKVDSVFIILYLFALAVIAMAFTGCTSTGKVIKALQNDKATVSLNVVHPYGQIKLVRTNPGTNQTVIVSPDGTVTINEKK